MKRGEKDSERMLKVRGTVTLGPDSGRLRLSQEPGHAPLANKQVTEGQMHRTGRSALTGVEAGQEDHEPLGVAGGAPRAAPGRACPPDSLGAQCTRAALSYPTRPHAWSTQKSDITGKPERLTFPGRKYAVRDSAEQLCNDHFEAISRCEEVPAKLAVSEQWTAAVGLLLSQTLGDGRSQGTYAPFVVTRTG